MRGSGYLLIPCDGLAMVTTAVGAKEAFLSEGHKSLLKICWTFAVLEVYVGNCMCPWASRRKCMCMADQMESIEVEFLTIVFVEIIMR